MLPEKLAPHLISLNYESDRLVIVIEMVLAGELYLVGIQPANTQFGQILSLPVAAAIDELARFLLEIFPAGTHCS